MDHIAITHELLEKIAEEANSGTTTDNEACRDFCVRVIAQIRFDSPAYADSVAGLLRMPHLIRGDERAAA